MELNRYELDAPNPDQNDQIVLLLLIGQLFFHLRTRENLSEVVEAVLGRWLIYAPLKGANLPVKLADRRLMLFSNLFHALLNCVSGRSQDISYQPRFR